MRDESKWEIAKASTAIIVFVGAVMLALGVQSPQVRLSKVEMRLDVVEPKVNLNQVVIAQMKQEVDDIHEAILGGRVRNK